VLELIDGAVYSSEIPWTKPHPEAFRAALAAVDVDDPADAVFVGDRPFDDIHGAKSVGMHAVLLPHSDIPDIQKGPVEGEADAIIQRLADLLAVVDALR
jgi:putative hydrolase of the HAD superfamily